MGVPKKLDSQSTVKQLRDSYHVSRVGKKSARRQEVNIDCLAGLGELRSRISSFTEISKQLVDNPIDQDGTKVNYPIED